MRLFLFLVFLLAGTHVYADCKPLETLQGVVSIPTCESGSCVSGAKAIYEYSNRIKDDPEVLLFNLHSSPWRFYDDDMRILTIEEVARMAKPYIANGAKRIVLMGSWTGASPNRNEKSLAQRLSTALGGFPVSGMDGFLWLAKDGSARTTRQAFSVRKGKGEYKIKTGTEVMVSMVAGWPTDVEGLSRRVKDSDGVMRAAAGWDIFFLCPDSALSSFEAASQLSNPIAAYNAALIRLERIW
jgi:hypothetical protein